MYFSKIFFVVLGSASAAQAFGLGDTIDSIKRSLPAVMKRKGGDSGSGSGGGGGGGKCPAIWTQIGKDLRGLFLDKTNGQCNDYARAAIREAFHDCGAWEIANGPTGGCDGSLILSTGPDNERDRGENNGQQVYSQVLWDLQKHYASIDPSVTVADLIQFANSVAITTCPGGPLVKAWVGRKDSSVPAPHSLLPDVFAPAADLYALFQRKGFNARELAALLGAHSTSKAFSVPGAAVGAAQDSTPGLWDVKYYAETLNPPKGVFVFPSDSKLAVHGDVGKEFKGFVGNQGKWTGKFADAMEHLSLLGVPNGTKNLIDCTGAVPKGTSKRDMRSAPINDRAR